MPDLTVFAVPAFLVLILLEIMVGEWHQRQTYEIRDSLASLAMGFGSVLINLVIKALTFAFYAMIFELSPLDLGRSWWAWLLAFIAVDFLFYWFHRAEHRVRFLWAAHVNHHSSQHFNLSTALRQSWTVPLVTPFFFCPLPALGFDPVITFVVGAISTIFGFWVHTEHIGKLGPLEAFLNTPSHHRVHHGANPEYIDKNYGNLLIIWDKMFGTFEPEVAPVRYGLTTNINTFNPVKIAFHEWYDMLCDVARARTFGDRIRHLLMPPDWNRKPKSSRPAPLESAVSTRTRVSPQEATADR